MSFYFFYLFFRAGMSNFEFFLAVVKGQWSEPMRVNLIGQPGIRTREDLLPTRLGILSTYFLRCRKSYVTYTILSIVSPLVLEKFTFHRQHGDVVLTYRISDILFSAVFPLIGNICISFCKSVETHFTYSWFNTSC